MVDLLFTSGTQSIVIFFTDQNDLPSDEKYFLPLKSRKKLLVWVMLGINILTFAYVKWVSNFIVVPNYLYRSYYFQPTEEGEREKNPPATRLSP